MRIHERASLSSGFIAWRAQSPKSMTHVCAQVTESYDEILIRSSEFARKIFRCRGYKITVSVYKS